MGAIVLRPIDGGGYMGGRGAELRYSIRPGAGGFRARDEHRDAEIATAGSIEEARAAIEKRARRTVRLAVR